MSQFFDLASMVLVPSGYRNGKLYSQKPLSADGELTFTRASNATRVNSDGLIEKVRTNLLTYSEDFSNAAWIKSNVTVSANTAVAPNGTTTADTITATAANGEIGQYLTQSTIHYALTFYVKSATGAPVNILIGGASSAATYTTYTATNEWTRVTNVVLSLGGNRGSNVRIVNSGDSIFLWGAQLEVSDFGPTDYIETTSAAVSVGPVSGLPRLDYSGGCPSLLLEPQTTALNFFSEQADNAYWSKEGTTISANTTATLDPSGYNGADKLQEDSSTGVHRYGKGTFASGTKRTFSVFAKKAERDYVVLFENNTVAPQVTGVIFNLANGTVQTNNAPSFYLNPTIVEYTNGWYRCSATWTPAALSVPSVGVSANGTTNSYAGTTGSGIYVWGVNLTETSYLQSYIPTLGSAVTRLADSAYKTGISSLIGQTEGTLFVEYSALSNDLTYRSIGLNSGTATNRLLITFNNVSNNINFLVQVGGVTQVSINYSGATITSNLKVAFAYKENDFVAYVNGTQVGTDTSGSTYSSGTLTTFSFDNSVGADKLVAKLNQALLFKTRLTNAQLAELTTL